MRHHWVETSLEQHDRLDGMAQNIRSGRLILKGIEMAKKEEKKKVSISESEQKYHAEKKAKQAVRDAHRKPKKVAPVDKPEVVKKKK